VEVTSAGANSRLEETLTIGGVSSMEFLSQNSLYIVLIVVLIVWLGVFTYLNRIDGRVKKLEQDLSKH
jgi:CcmD family protein